MMLHEKLARDLLTMTSRSTMATLAVGRSIVDKVASVSPYSPPSSWWWSGGTTILPSSLGDRLPPNQEHPGGDTDTVLSIFHTMALILVVWIYLKMLAASFRTIVSVWRWLLRVGGFVLESGKMVWGALERLSLLVCRASKWFYCKGRLLRRRLFLWLRRQQQQQQQAPSEPLPVEVAPLAAPSVARTAVARTAAPKGPYFETRGSYKNNKTVSLPAPKDPYQTRGSYNSNKNNNNYNNNNYSGFYDANMHLPPPGSWDYYTSSYYPSSCQHYYDTYASATATAPPDYGWQPAASSFLSPRPSHPSEPHNAASLEPPPAPRPHYNYGQPPTPLPNHNRNSAFKPINRGGGNDAPRDPANARNSNTKYYTCAEAGTQTTPLINQPDSPLGGDSSDDYDDSEEERSTFTFAPTTLAHRPYSRHGRTSRNNTAHDSHSCTSTFSTGDGSVSEVSVDHQQNQDNDDDDDNDYDSWMKENIDDAAQAMAALRDPRKRKSGSLEPPELSSQGRPKKAKLHHHHHQPCGYEAAAAAPPPGN